MAEQRRRKGEGTLVKRGKNFSIRYIDENGKPKVKALGTSVEREAEKRAKEFMKLKAAIKTKGSFVDSIAESKGIIDKQKILEIKKTLSRTHGTNIRISEAFQIYLKDPNKSNAGESTLKEYKRYWQKFVDSVENDQLCLHEISSIQVREFASSLLDENPNPDRKIISPQTYNKIIRFCKMLVSTLSHTTGMKENPFDYLKTKQTKAINKRELSLKELDRLLEAAKGEFRLLFALGAYTGMRLKDAVLCRWENVDLSNNFIQVKPAKTERFNKYINLPILPPLRIELDTLAICEESEFILPALANRYSSHRSNLTKDIKKTFSDAEIFSNNKGTVGFHSLRHTFVSECAKAGVSLAIIQELVGHGSPAMTRHYTHIDKETTSAQISKLSKRLEGKGEKTLEEVLVLVESMDNENWESIKGRILSNE